MQDGKRQITTIRMIRTIAVRTTSTIRVIKTLRIKIRIQAALSPAIRQAVLQIKIQIPIPERKEEMEMQEKEQSRSSRLVMRHPLFFLLPLGCAALCLLLCRCLKGRKSVLEGQMEKCSLLFVYRKGTHGKIKRFYTLA